MNHISTQLPFRFDQAEKLSSTRSWRGTTNTEADGVYGWYRYIQDFTGDFAEGWLAKLFADGELVWDPFVGSGTTIVAAKKLGLPSVGYDVSPFMVDVVAAKTDWEISADALASSLSTIIARSKVRFDSGFHQAVPWSQFEAETAGRDDFQGDIKLRKWMSPSIAAAFRWLVKEIENLPDARVRRFLRLAVAASIIPASNMVLKPNISYRPKATLHFPVFEYFDTRCRLMIAELAQLSKLAKTRSPSEVGDARVDGPSHSDGIFTSPPYPNDMEYVHQTRLELALLNHVSERKELTVLKKKMVSSSVKLVYRDNDWQKWAGLEVDLVKDLYGDIAETLVGKDWGWNPADMIAQYFGGMRKVMRNWHDRLPAGSVAAVVVGDSAFNGVKVATDEVLARCGEMEGFDVEDISVFRQRYNGKHEIQLRESVVVLRKRRFVA